MKYSIKQLSKNLPRLWMVGIIMMLAYLVLSFIITLFLEFGQGALSPRVGFDFTDIHEIKINWNTDFGDDKQYYSMRREQLKSLLQKERFVEQVSFSAKSVIDDPEYYAYTREYGIIGVEDNFMTTLGHQFVKGRDFTKTDLDHPIPGIIITESAAKEKNINSTGDDVLLKITFNKEELNFRVLGIVKDLEIHDRMAIKYPVFVFANRHKNKIWLNTQADWLYLKTNKLLTKSEIENRLKKIIEDQGFMDQMLEFETRTLPQVIEAKMYAQFKEFKPVLAIMLLLIIYISTTLFGIFHKHVQKKKEEFAIRRALGCQRSGIYLKVFNEALLMALPGIILAGLLYLNFLFLQNKLAFWMGTVLPFFIIILVIMLSVAWPAYKAASIHPVEGLREA